MFYRTRLAIHWLRTLIWLPFHWLSYRRVLAPLLLLIAILCYPDREAMVMIGLPIWAGLFMLGRVSWVLRPGTRPSPPKARVKPSPRRLVAQAASIGTRVSNSPGEHEILSRLPFTLQRFLADERSLLQADIVSVPSSRAAAPAGPGQQQDETEQPHAPPRAATGA